MMRSVHLPEKMHHLIVFSTARMATHIDTLHLTTDLETQRLRADGFIKSGPGSQGLAVLTQF